MTEPLNFGRPWLQNPEWVSRRIVSRTRGRIHGCFWASAVLVFTFVGPLFAIIGGRILDPTDSGVSIFLFGGSLIAAGAITLWWMLSRGLNRWKRPPKPFEMVCHLKTFPGVIGGWFKAEIEAPLPEAPTELHLHLTCLEQAGRHPRLIWKAEATPPTATARAGRNGVYRIPVAFQIPELEEYNAPLCWWVLNVIAVSGENIAYDGTFKVPVFATHLAPESEQTAPAKGRGA